MSNRKHCIWTWRDEDGVPKYVGWGAFAPAHPAKRLWARRKLFPSELNRWLVHLTAEPAREKVESVVLLSGSECRAAAAALTLKYKREGIAILSGRPEGTKHGGGAGREVFGPEGELYESVRCAAVEMGVNASTITRWCQQVDTEWDYVPEKGTK